LSNDLKNPTLKKPTIKIARRGLMMVLSSPSGAGKSTISRALLATDDALVMSVSATTRPKRPSESEGIDYYFMDDDAFSKLVNDGGMLEYATVFDHSYGTPREPVEQALATGQDVLFDVDWQGTQQLSEQARSDLVSIFILPPSMQELERRLYARAQDSDDVVKSRMAKAGSEISHYAEYDYILINGEINVTKSHVHAILEAERLKRDRSIGLGDFVRGLGIGQ